MMCPFLSSCCRVPHSPTWICAAHTKPRAAIAMVVWLPESVGLKMPWLQVVTPCFTVQMAAGEEDGSFKSDLTHWLDVLGQAVRSGKTGVSAHQKWVRAGSASTEPHQAVSSLLPQAIWIRSWPVSSCFHLAWALAFFLVETKPKGWRAGVHLGHFPAGLPGWWGHVAKVHRFTRSFCLPGFTLNNTMAFGACLHRPKASLPFHVDSAVTSPAPEAHLPEHTESLWPITPGWLAQNLWPTDCPPASSGVPIKQPGELKADGDSPSCAYHYFGWQSRKF